MIAPCLPGQKTFEQAAQEARAVLDGAGPIWRAQVSRRENGYNVCYRFTFFAPSGDESFIETEEWMIARALKAELDRAGIETETQV